MRLLTVAYLGAACGESPVSSSETEVRPAFATKAAYSILTIPLLAGSTHAEAIGINDDGTLIVGTAHYPDQIKKAFRFSLGLEGLGTLTGHTSSEAYDVNNAGQIVGVSWPPPPGGGHAFLFTPGKGMASIHDGSIVSWSEAHAINNAGVVVGAAKTWSGEWRAFRWSPSTGMILLEGAVDPGGAWDINDQGTIVGNVYRNGDRAYLWEPNGTRRFIGPGFAKAINEQGVVVGIGFSYTPGRGGGWETVPNMYGYGISDKGRIVGFYHEEGAATWYNGQATILPALNSHYMSRANDVSDCGTIVGMSKVPSQYATGMRAVVWYKGFCD